MDAIVNIGLNGMQDGYRRASEDAQRVVSAFSSSAPESAVDALVSLQADQRQVQASAVVVRTGDQLMGSILDIFA